MKSGPRLLEIKPNVLCISTVEHLHWYLAHNHRQLKGPGRYGHQAGMTNVIPSAINQRSSADVEPLKDLFRGSDSPSFEGALPDVRHKELSEIVSWRWTARNNEHCSAGANRVPSDTVFKRNCGNI